MRSPQWTVLHLARSPRRGLPVRYASMARMLEGQSAIVTGGARGIGLGIAQRLAAEGCRVALWDQSFKQFDARAAGFEPAAMEAMNVADHASVERGFAAT